MLISLAYAQGAGGGAGSGFEALLPLVLIFVVFYFLLIRPQQKKMKQHRDLLASVSKGDKIVTGGGIVGKVTKVEGDEDLTVQIATDVKVIVKRSLVSTVIEKPKAASAKKTDKTAEQPGQGGSLLGKLFGSREAESEKTKR